MALPTGAGGSRQSMEPASAAASSAGETAPTLVKRAAVGTAVEHDPEVAAAAPIRVGHDFWREWVLSVWESMALEWDGDCSGFGCIGCSHVTHNAAENAPW
jgi:hypothetical protein